METPEFVTENAVLAEGFPMIGCDHDFFGVQILKKNFDVV